MKTISFLVLLAIRTLDVHYTQMNDEYFQYMHPYDHHHEQMIIQNNKPHETVPTTSNSLNLLSNNLNEHFQNKC